MGLTLFPWPPAAIKSAQIRPLRALKQREGGDERQLQPRKHPGCSCEWFHKKIWEKEGEILILNKLIHGSSPGLGFSPSLEHSDSSSGQNPPHGGLGNISLGKSCPKCYCPDFPQGKFLVEVKKQWAVHKLEWNLKFSGFLPPSCHLYQNDFVLCLWIDVCSLVIFVMPSPGFGRGFSSCCRGLKFLLCPLWLLLRLSFISIILAFHLIDVFCLHPLGSFGNSERKNGIIEIFNTLNGVQMPSQGAAEQWEFSFRPLRAVSTEDMNPVHVSLLFWSFWDFFPPFLDVLKRCLSAQGNPRAVSQWGEQSQGWWQEQRAAAHQNPLRCSGGFVGLKSIPVMQLRFY